MGTTYETWRSGYSDPENAARDAFYLAEIRLKEQRRLFEALGRAAEVARNACEGWNDALMHEGAQKAADAVQELLTPNVELTGGASAPSSDRRERG